MQRASAVVWRWSEVKPANGQCSSIMRLRRPLSGAQGGELPLRPRLPSDIGCPDFQEGKKKKRKKRAIPDPLEGRGSLTPTGCSQVAVSGGKRTSRSAQITASLAAARGGKDSGGAAVCFDMMTPLVQLRYTNSGVQTYITIMYL